MVTLDDIHSAMRRIRSSIYLSPCALSATFSESTGNEVYLKLDNLQRTGAFKERGALNKLLSLSTEERAQGVIAPRPEITRKALPTMPANLASARRFACL